MTQYRSYCAPHKTGVSPAAKSGGNRMLLIGAGLMIRSFAKLQNVALGINAEGLLTMKLELAGSKCIAFDFDLSLVRGGKPVSCPSVSTATRTGFASSDARGMDGTSK